MKFLYNPPVIIKQIFSDFRWNTTNKEILLTFDDGPNPGSTEIILDTLNQHNLKAAFFCVGNNVKNYPHLIRLIIEQGHILANHTFNHQNVTFLNNRKWKCEIEAVNNLLFNEYGYKVKYFRPPHGRFGFSLRANLNQRMMQNVMWSLLTYDYKNDINIVKFAVKKYLTNDAIVVFHDSRKSKHIIKSSIDYIFEISGKRGYKIGAPSECLK